MIVEFKSGETKDLDDCPGFEREGDAGCWERKVWGNSSELTKVWNCLKLLLMKISKLGSRGLK